MDSDTSSRTLWVIFGAIITCILLFGLRPDLYYGLRIDETGNMTGIPETEMKPANIDTSTNEMDPSTSSMTAVPAINVSDSSTDTSLLPQKVSVGPAVAFEQRWTKAKKKLMKGRRKKLRVVHLHKCGGTAFCHAAKMNKEVPGKDNCNAPDGKVQLLTKPSKAISFANMSCTQREKLHENLSLAATEATLELQTCTNIYRYILLIRDPIERIRSHVAYHKMQMADVVRMLNGGPQARHSDHKAWAPVEGMFDNFFIRSILGGSTFFQPLRSITRSHLQKAKQKLHRTVSVVLSLLGQTQDVLECLRVVTRWKAVSFPHSNKGGRPKQDTAQQHKVLRRVNALDIELYNFAMNISRSCKEHLIRQTLGNGM